ncbi:MULTISPECIES: monovalent cation/H(+) antiporter subunit G [Brevibacterium]|uniref:Monovalent cation/H(+) antiporter subunit G n=1 Tax=Brevibacterium luteolum TaxID=199591 RepID=A0A849AVH7_9MICO|nr:MULTISPECIES: monovalent cation/H(+) antiporter subunit G [Brevibacterium]MBM7529922.1 multicomponent Na+:H+ antiporter subunit G [Brevibacterium luteolum]MCT1829731.1 monovalent cation/H(+) antiporter subunit G [Brevibacterium luteolum]MCT1872469.1 monovalent cation/H(+) antiporter subunit G [Brevibacterium luteolum]MCT1890209.1 monovalent cation/H(+) antiporter subunit G [Brevibacterium luteolum]MCT1892729.1 monovalent cation/H(+) antiporter subunit G [Brevibacterium luteolum]
MIADILSGALLIGSAALSLAASIGLLRFPDLMSRLHAGSKPQILGLILMMVAISIQQFHWGVITTLLLIVTLQMVTTPVGTHMVGRAGYRTKHLRRSMLYRDELSDAVALAEERDAIEHERRQDG